VTASEPPTSSRWPVVLFSLAAFFLLLGTRGLNEPDEGRYAEIAREMIERGDWLVPHLWYVPHLDKPPVTYWLVAASLKLFGLNAWAVRLPLALAGLSGVWAAFLLARSIAGAGAGRTAALVLASSMLFWAMARMLTTDIFLTQFITWSLYFFWRSWRELDALSDEDEDARGRAGRKSFLWQVAAWAALAGGFLTKGPVAVAIPFAAVVALLVFRRADKVRLNILLIGAVGGTLIFSLLALPWYFAVFKAVPGSFDFMVKGQAIGHSLGGIDNRGKPFYFFIGVLAAGFLPWTPLLGWLWRRAHWRLLGKAHRDAWVLLTAWAAFTFVLFSLTRAKLPAYIVPMFPALAVLVAMRWREGFEEWGQEALASRLRTATACCAWLPLITLPLVFKFAFKLDDQPWMRTGMGLGCFMVVAVAFFASRHWNVRGFPLQPAAMSAVALLTVLFWTPEIETRLRSNQTLAPLGAALRAEVRPGDAILCMTRIPQGLPFHAFPAINATNRPFIHGFPMHRVPFAFPGNADRMKPLLIPDEPSLSTFLGGDRRVLVVGFKGDVEKVRRLLPDSTPRLVLASGEWELFSNR